MTPDDLAAIRRRDAAATPYVVREGEYAECKSAMYDRRALLAEVDRLRDQLARHRAFGGHVDATLAERARIRAEVEAKRLPMVEGKYTDAINSQRASWNAALGAVLAAIDGEGE